MPELTGTENAAGAAPIVEPSAVASLEKVSAAAASSAADPNATKPPIDAGAGTTVQPGQPGANVGAQGDATKAGEDAAWLGIPEERRNVILENTRKKAHDAAIAEVESKLGWAKDVQPEDVQSAFGLAQQVARDPVAFVAQLISEIRQIPQLAATLDTALGGTGTKAERGKMPSPRLKAEDGTLAYSSDQVMEIVGNLKAEFEEMLGGRVQPLEDFRGSLEEREEVMNVIHQSRTESQELLGEMRQLAHWPEGDNKKAGEAKIAEYLAAIPAETKRRIGAIASMYQAYNTYLQKDIFPTLGSKTEQEVRDNLRRKAAAGTGTVAPGAGGAQPVVKKPTNPTELAAHLAKLAQSA